LAAFGAHFWLRLLMSKRNHCSWLIVVALALWLPAASFAQKTKKSEPQPESPHLRKTPIKDAPRGMTLLAGYEHEGEIDFEGTIWGKIWKKDGLEIIYAMGPVFGQFVTPKYKDSYLQYWEKAVGGRVVRFAFSKSKYLLITVPLDDAPDTINAANFSAKVEKPEGGADMVRMALSLIEGKK
jgi:hypothetical protein